MNYNLQTPAQLGSHLRALRKAKGLSQAALGARLGLSQARIARIEGEPLSVGVGQLFQLLAALGARVSLQTDEPAAKTSAASAKRRASGDW
jgi:HTH-type transcriptional regulator/antitoxin HipB